MLMYSRILICISNPKHGEEMARLALAVSGKDSSLVFLRICSRVNDSEVKKLDSDLSFIKSLKKASHPVKFEKRLVEGRDYARAILDAAGREKCDLIVMGSALHKSFIEKLTQDIGSVVMKKSKSAVVLVKSRE